MSVGRIPWTAIDRYANRYEMDDEEFERFELLLREMDDAFMSHHNQPKT